MRTCQAPRVTKPATVPGHVHALAVQLNRLDEIISRCVLHPVGREDVSACLGERCARLCGEA